MEGFQCESDENPTHRRSRETDNDIFVMVREGEQLVARPVLSVDSFGRVKSYFNLGPRELSLYSQPDLAEVLVRFSKPEKDVHSGKCTDGGNLAVDTDQAQINEFDLLTTKPIRLDWRVPSHEEATQFLSWNSQCVVQGDWAPGEQPPCKRAKLVGLSDLNVDKVEELWVQTPYLRETGLVFGLREGESVSPLVEICVGCDD